VPWAALIALIDLHYPKVSKKGGRPQYPLATMHWIQLLLQWYSLSDAAMEVVLIEVSTMLCSAGINLISDRIPDATTILTFRHLLQKHDLGEQIFDTVNAHLSARDMKIGQGITVDIGSALDANSDGAGCCCARHDYTPPRFGYLARRGH